MSLLLTVKSWKKQLNQFFMQFKTEFHLEMQSVSAVLNDSNFLGPTGESLDRSPPCSLEHSKLITC